MPWLDTSLPPHSETAAAAEDESGAGLGRALLVSLISKSPSAREGGPGPCEGSSHCGVRFKEGADYVSGSWLLAAS